MKRITACLGIVSILVLLPVLRAAPSETGGKPDGGGKQPTIGVVVVGNVDGKLLERVEAWLNANFRPLKCARRDAGKLSADLPAEQLAPKLRAVAASDDLCILAVVQNAGDRGIDRAVFATNSIAIVYPEALKTRSVKLPAASERYSRRVEKECIRAVALALGLRPCAFPLCAMYGYANEPELDIKGRNLCPPCQMKMEKLLAEKGVKQEEPVARP